MNRRQLSFTVTLLAIGALVAPNARAQPTYKVSTEQLHQVLAQRFPRQYAAAGWIDLRIETPVLRMLPDQNRVASTMQVQISGEALRRNHTGMIDLDFGLRWEPGDRTIRAHQIRVQAIRLPSLTSDAAALIDASVRQAVERSLLEVVLHTLRPQDLTLAHTMGFEPGSITVAPDGLVIGFVPREVR